jgi:orotate phosphoribosyltransferase
MSERERLKQILCEKSLTTGDFKLASGARTTYYLDAKPTILDPEGLSCALSLFWDELVALQEISGKFPKAVGGPSTGANPIVAALVALSFWKGGPFLSGFYIREEAKTHGTMKQVEGYEGKPGDPVVIVDDVCTKGGSASHAIEQARRQGWEVIGYICLADRQEGGEDRIEKHNCPFRAIFTARELLAASEETSLHSRAS